MAKRTAITNQKGGVGKTTTAINVSGALNDLGEDVMFVDTDPQGNGTEGLGFAAEYDDPSEPNLASVLLENQDEAPEIVVDHEEMRVVPSNVEMFNVEDKLRTEMRSRQRLGDALDAIEAVFDPDHIIIDCPPWLGILTDSALVACDGIIVPAPPESTSERAVDILYEQVASVEAHYNISIPTHAIVANRAENDGERDRVMQWLRDTFQSSDDPDDHVPIFEIRKRVALKRAWSNGVSIFQHDDPQGSDMEYTYLKIAEVIA